MTPNSTQPIKDALQRLMMAMTRLGLEVEANLQPGLTRQEILNAFAGINLAPSEDVIGFYEFSNGVISEGMQDYQYAIFFSFEILPLQEAVEIYKDLIDFWEDNNLEKLHPSCFPLFGWDSDYYVIDFIAERGGQPYIISCSPELGVETVYSNLRSMIETLAEEYEQGEFTFEDDDVEYHGGPKSYEIAQKNNPDVPKWNGGPSPFVNFGPSHTSQDVWNEKLDISHLIRRFTKNPLGPHAVLYTISYASPDNGTTVFEVVIIIPSKHQLPPVAYISKPPPFMKISDEQMIREAASDVREQYGFVADVGSDESLAWRNKMPQYMQMLAGI